MFSTSAWRRNLPPTARGATPLDLKPFGLKLFDLKRVGLLLVLCGLTLTGCSGTRSSRARYSPAMAARQKVEFLRKEGLRLNPYQQALIHQIPYDVSGSGRLQRDMSFILTRGAVDPGHEAGYRRRRLSALLAEQQERDKAAKAASGEQ